MDRVFLISPDDAHWRRMNNYLISAVHECSLPGVACNVCKRTWSTTGLIYPSVDFSLLSDLRSSLEPRLSDLYEFDRLFDKIQMRLGIGKYILAPGTEFGPLRGSAMGKFGDFAWVNPWTPLVRASVFEKLLARGLDLIGVEANLRFRKKGTEPLIELEAHPTVELHPLCLPCTIDKCPECGWEGLTAPEKIIVVKSSMQKTDPIQRIARLPTYLVVNDKLASAILEMNLLNVTLKEIPMN